MKKLYKLTGFLSFLYFVATAAQASVLVLYTFDSDTGFTPEAEFVGPGLISASAWQTTASNLRNFAGESGQAVAHGGDHTFSFSVGLGEGVVLELESLSFWARRSATGSPDWVFSVNGHELASFSAMSDTATGVSFSDLALPYAGIDPLTGELNFTLETFGAEAGTGIFRVDNFSLSGTVSPIPEPRYYGLALGLLALGGVACRRRINYMKKQNA